MASDAQVAEVTLPRPAGPVGGSEQSVAANQGVSEEGAGTAAQERARQEQVSAEDLRRLQRTLNQQADQLRNQLAKSQQESTAAVQALQQEILAKEQEILRLRTENLPTEQAEVEKARYERDAMQRHLKSMEAAYAKQVQQQQAIVEQMQNTQAKSYLVKAFLDGVPGKMTGYKKYGLTAEELENCQSGEEMESLARTKAEAYLEKKAQELERANATVRSEERKEAGATKFDKGEATSGGLVLPKAGTPEFAEFTRKVASGEIRFRR